MICRVVSRNVEVVEFVEAAKSQLAGLLVAAAALIAAEARVVPLTQAYLWRQVNVLLLFAFFNNELKCCEERPLNVCWQP